MKAARDAVAAAKELVLLFRSDVPFASALCYVIVDSI